MSTDAYLDAKANFERVAAKLSELGGRLVSVGIAIRDRPQRFIFANAPAALPPEATMSRDSVSDDGRTWPTAAHVNELLAEWHEAKSKMEGAWHSIPADRRSGLVPPTTLHGRHQ